MCTVAGVVDPSEPPYWHGKPMAVVEAAHDMQEQSHPGRRSERGAVGLCVWHHLLAGIRPGLPFLAALPLRSPQQ